MDFVWKEVDKQDEGAVVDLLCSEDVRFATPDVVFYDFCQCWQKELREDFFVRSIYLDGVFVAAIVFSRSVDAVYTILEFAVVPRFREQRLGSRIVGEFISCSSSILGEKILDAVAVIEWDNYRAQGVFESAGFVNSGTHPDGDACYFRYKKT